MKKTLSLLFILVFTLGSMGLLSAQQNKEDQKFNKTLDKYFDALWKFYPTAATMAGFHKYDKKLEDLDKKDIEKRHEELDELNREFVANIDKSALSQEVQIEHEIIINSLSLELTKHEMTLPWAYNPLFYNDILLNSVRSLMTGTFGSAEERTKNAVDRLDDLPKLIKQAKENLETPPQLHTETAIKQFPAVLNFYKNELPQLIEEAPAAQKPKLQEKLAKVIPALEDYNNYLSHELLPKSTGNFRLSTAHTRLLRANFQNDLPVQELIARTKADMYNIRREMFLVCIPFYRIMYPEINLEQLTTQRGEEQVRNIVIKGVLDNIKGDHVSSDQFIEKIKSIKNEVKDFIKKNQLIDIPENNLNITEMPLEAQGITWTRLLCPPIYETGTDYTLQISPLEDDLSEENIQSLLEEYNNYFLPFYTIRKIYPGQFVPYFYLNKDSSLLKKSYPSMLLIKGWPIYIEEMLVKAGYGNYDLRLRLNQLKLKLKAVIDFSLDLNIHQGGLTKEQAVRLMTITGFQTTAEAEKNWNRIILKPLDATYAYVGYQELLDMEKTYKQKAGDSFSQKEFLAKVLSYGMLPLRFLKQKIEE
jgi:hypothetical protein